MRLAARYLVILCIAVLAPASAFAQASLTGTVHDASGAVLPGVTVETSSPVLIEKTRTAVTDSSGLYRIVDLRPGTYSMTFTLPGFNTVKRDGIVVAGSATLTIAIEMKVGDLQETITVTGETPVVDVQNTRRETVLSADTIAALPATRAYGSVLNVTPGLTVDNNGQALTPTMTFFSAHGGASNEGRMQINGMTVAAAFNGGGVSSLAYNTTDADEVSVLVSGGLGESETGGPAMNIVPRSGGNRYAGQAFFNTAGKWSTADNLDDTLRGQGLTQAPGVINAHDASVSFGGPVKKDRLWFYGSYRSYVTASNADGSGANLYAGDPSHWDYARDTSVGTRLIQGRDIWTARGTGQVTPKNRVTFSYESQARCEGSTLTTEGTNGCRTRDQDWIGLGSATQSPEANTGYFDFPYSVTQATWTSPVTNKMLLEAGYSRFWYRHANGPGQLPPDGIFDLIPVTEASSIQGHPANFTYRGLGSYSNNVAEPINWRASMSYVTGRHNMKFGYQGSYLISNFDTIADDTQTIYNFNNGVPQSFTVRVQDWHAYDRTATTSLYGQDTWTHNKLSVQGALRYDHAQSWSPGEGNGTTTLTQFTTAPITFDKTYGVNAFNDLSPRVGAAYDVFGNGKTAIKFNMGRYLAPATNDTIYTVNNPANRIRTTMQRNWTDSNHNFVVDCDVLNFAAQDLSASGGDVCPTPTGANLNFGSPVITGSVDPRVLSGWGVRPVDWQIGLGVQQQLLPRVSLEASYNRRWWGNYTVTDNSLIGPSDFDKFTITAPTDPRLPGGGGYPLDVYAISAAANARGSQTLTTGEGLVADPRVQHWNGVDLTLNARLRGSLQVQAGSSTGRLYQDTCATVTDFFTTTPDPRNCHSVEPFRTDFRGNASYTVPKVGVLVSGTLRSQAALQITTANWLVPNTVIQQLLGRLPAGGTATGTTTINLVDNGDHRLYADNRRTQVDMRFAKVIRFQQRRLDVGVDLTNLLNTNYANTYQNTYSYSVGTATTANGGTWEYPATIVTPRFVRLNFTLNF